MQQLQLGCFNFSDIDKTSLADELRETADCCSSLKNACRHQRFLRLLRLLSQHRGTSRYYLLLVVCAYGTQGEHKWTQLRTIQFGTLASIGAGGAELATMPYFAWRPKPSEAVDRLRSDLLCSLQPDK